MERINQILKHPEFRRALEEIDRLEADRAFCRHGLDHLLSVARLMLIYAREEGVDLSRELIYAAALLHDIGRGAQYADGTPHEEAAVDLALPILADCGFMLWEAAEIVEAITAHRTGESASDLGRLLYRADKMSRPCFACSAVKECSWPEEQKNFSLEY